MDLDDLLAQARGALGTSPLTPLGQGGQKLVYMTELGGIPAVAKVVLIPETDHAEETLERARREVELLSTVESPFVVRVLSEAVEIGERPEAVCWVEELLDGVDVTALLGTPWSPDDVRSLLLDGASGLAACHELDVVHRDLSPGNVRRRQNSRYVLMDPGFARHLKKGALTGVYQPGTPGYLTPEHVPGGNPTPASDVFGLGILAYQALTGEVPVLYRGDAAAYYHELRTGQVRPVASVRPETPADIAFLVDRCLQRQPARRFLDATELLDEMEGTRS